MSTVCIVLLVFTNIFFFNEFANSSKLCLDIPSTSDQKVDESQASLVTNEVQTASTLSSDAKKPVEKETTKQLDFTNSNVETCQEKIQVGIFNSSPNPRRYFTRQSLRMSSSANNSVILLNETAKDIRPNTSKCVEESDKSDNNHNQKNESSVKNHPELLRKWQVLIVLRSVLGDDFKEVLKQLHNEYKKNYLVLESLRLAFVKNCKIIEEFIKLTDEVTNGPDISGIGATVENLENSTMKMDVKKNNSDEVTKLEVQNVAQKEKKKKHNSNGAEVLVAALRSVLGDNFKEVLKQLHKKFERNHLMLGTMRLAFIKNCEPIEELTKLTDEVIHGPDVSDLGAKMKELENSMMEVDLNKNNSNEVTGSEVQNDAQKQKKKKHNSDVTEVENNNPLNKIRGQARKFTFPPEYDPNDSRWTLKHRNKKKGLVELVPDSRVYVDAIQLGNCKIISKDSKTLARALLLEIFRKSALSVCSLTGKRANAFDFEGTCVRPGLDEHSIIILLSYVEKHALEQKWAVFKKNEILQVLRNKIQEMRGKYE